MIRWIIIIAFSTIAAVLTIYRPTVLADNDFLGEFVSHEILALLIIIVTITLASIGNIHLTITRLASRFENKAEGELAAKPARDELNSSGWSLLWAFGVCVVVLLLKGAYGSDVYVRSGANGAALIVLLFNMLVLKDIYETVFDLVEQDGAAGEHKGE